MLISISPKKIKQKTFTTYGFCGFLNERLSMDGMYVVYFRATWHTLLLKLKKIKKIHPEKNSLYSRKWNFLALILKKFRKRKPRKKNSFPAATRLCNNVGIWFSGRDVG